MLIGFFGGLFGIGGGIIGIPLLLNFFNEEGMPPSLSMHMAIGTMLATAIPTTIVSIYRHYRKQMILVSILRKILPGAIVGSFLGAMISSHTNSIYLQRIFALFIFFIALQMLLQLLLHNEIQPRQVFPNEKIVFVTTLLIGIFSGLLGLGGGVLMVPYLNWCGISIRHAVATATACLLPVTIVGALTYMMVPNVQLANVTSLNSGFIYWPAFLGMSMTSVLFAPIGVHIVHKAPMSVLKVIFATLLIVVAIKFF